MKKLITFFIILIISLSLFAGSSEQRELSLIRKLLYETARVLESSNNVTVLDEISSYDWYPDIDILNSNYIVNFNSAVNDFKSIEQKRDRLEYIYNQKKDMSISALVPNALSIGTIAFTADNPKQALIAITGTALSSVSNYLTQKEVLDLELIQKQWELDDQAMAVFVELGNELFTNLSMLSAKYGFSHNDYASINTLRNFVKVYETASTPNEVLLKLRGQNFEKELNMFSDYWRILAINSYEIGDYKSALEYIEKFEACYEKVFYHDINYSHLMLIKAYCIDELYPNNVNKYRELERIVEIILDNATEYEYWAYKYYCYHVFLDLASYKNDESYLHKAYELLIEIIGIVSDEYIRDMDDFFSGKKTEDAIAGIQTNIINKENKIAEYKEEVKNARSKQYKKQLENKIDFLKDDVSALKKNMEIVEKSSSTILPPTTSLLISLTSELIDLAINTLDYSDRQDFALISEKIYSCLKDNYSRRIFFAEDNAIRFSAEYKNRINFIKDNKWDYLTIQIPLSYFTFMTDEFTKDDKLELYFNNIYFSCNYGSEYGWSYEIFYPENSVRKYESCYLLIKCFIPRSLNIPDLEGGRFKIELRINSENVLYDNFILGNMQF